MLRILVFALLLNVVIAGLYEDKMFNGNESIPATISVNCLDEFVDVKLTGEENYSLYLLYGSLVVDRCLDCNYGGQLVFFGKIKFITHPFTLRIDAPDRSRVMTFWIEECKEGASTIQLLNELKEEEPTINQSEKNETIQNETEEQNITEELVEIKQVEENKTEVKSKEVEEEKPLPCIPALFIGIVLMLSLNKLLNT